MEDSPKNRASRSGPVHLAYAFGLSALFFVGVMSGMWVSIRYFDEPAPFAAGSPSDARARGRITGDLPIPTWIDHPYRRHANALRAEFSAETAFSDLNRVFFGEAMASVPLDKADLPGAYASWQLRGAGDAVSALHAPGAVLYFAATVLSGMPERACTKPAARAEGEIPPARSISNVEDRTDSILRATFASPF